jgi:tetratricopeptide (TPR) repeat protein
MAIFTTRTREIAVRLAGSNIIALGKLEETEATELLRKRLAPEHHHQLKDHDTVDKILVMLFFHALAIVQAIAFINRNDITLHDYIALYESSEGDAVDLLNEDFRDHTRYREATNAVSRTWYISFEQIQKQDSIAAQHLFFMACTASNDIRAFMFPPDYTKTEHIKAIGTLKAYAFITERAIQVDGPRNYSQTYKQFDVHPLVHLAIRAWLKARLQWTVWLEKTLTRLLAITPWETYDDRDYWKTYLNHGIHVANLPEVKDKVDRVRLLDRLGSCEAELGRYQAAEQSFRQAYEQGRMMLGEEDIHTLMIKGRMGKAISLQGRWADAENIHRDVLTLVRPVAGERSEHTLFCRVNLAFDTLGQRKLVEAEEMFRQCLPLLREVLGESHLRTLGAMHNLGTLLGSQGKLEDAVRILRETFALLSETLGGEDASTLSTQSALATTLHYQQKHSQAELIHRQVLATRKRVLGDEHPDTVLSMSELGLALSGQHTDPAKLLEAEQLHREALALSFQHTGNSSRATLKQKSRLADTLRWQLKYEESEKLHREVLASRENVLGMDDPDTVGSVYGLAALAHDQMQYDDAMRLYERAYVGFMARYGAEHSVTKTCSDELTWVRRVVEEDRVAEAAKMQQGHGDDAFSEPMQALGVEGAARPIQKGWRKRLGHLIKKS